MFYIGWIWVVYGWCVWGWVLWLVLDEFGFGCGGVWFCGGEYWFFLVNFEVLGGVMCGFDLGVEFLLLF